MEKELELSNTSFSESDISSLKKTRKSVKVSLTPCDNISNSNSTRRKRNTLSQKSHSYRKTSKRNTSSQKSRITASNSFLLIFIIIFLKFFFIFLSLLLNKHYHFYKYILNKFHT